MRVSGRVDLAPGAAAPDPHRASVGIDRDLLEEGEVGDDAVVDAAEASAVVRSAGDGEREGYKHGLVRVQTGLRPGGGEYVTFVGRLGAQNAIERIDGFAQGAGDKFKSRDKMGDNIDLLKARQNVRD